MITVNGEKMEWQPEMTVKQVFDRKGWKFPDIAVWINGVPVKPDQYEETRVPDGAKVDTLHMVSGG
jgi:sulfur carrier protein